MMSEAAEPGGALAPQNFQMLIELYFFTIEMCLVS